MKRLFFLLMAMQCLALAHADSLFDRYCLVKDPMQRYPIPKEGEPVLGTQKTWFTMPYDLKPGTFSMSSDGLEAVNKKSFTITPKSVVGKFTYQFTLQENEPAGENQVPDRKLLNVRDVRFDQLKQIKDRSILIRCQVTQVYPHGKGFACTVDMASGALPFHVKVIAEKEVNRRPQVHSRQYGPHAKHVFDVYYPKNFKPGEDAPLPVYCKIHGGGWGALDKMNNKIGNEATSWNERGIAFVSINYRYVSEFDSHPKMKIPVAACLLDAARCIQYIRFHANRLGLDTSRICLTGGSAGGATSCWLAMVDDLADPASPDPIARMTTRVACSTPLQAQTSLDPKQMREWIPSITYGAHAFIADFPPELKAKDRQTQKRNYFDYWLKHRKEYLLQIKDFSPYAQASADDPPMLLVYGGQDDVIPAQGSGNATHHPKFGEHLCERLRDLGVECYYWAGTQRGQKGWVDAQKERYNNWGGVKNFVMDQFGLTGQK
ncbi:carboxylesterase family protein [bacterium]|nr:carboxylesterase family protein [bacterium]